MGPSKVGGRGSQGMEHNGLYWGMGAFWERSALAAPMVIEAAHGTCVLEAGESQLRSGRLRLCAGPPPSSAAAGSLQGRLDSWHRRHWRCQESGALARCGHNNERPARPHTSPTRDLGNRLPFNLRPEQPWVPSASAQPTSFSSHWEPGQLPTQSLHNFMSPPHHKPWQLPATSHGV